MHPSFQTDDSILDDAENWPDMTDESAERYGNAVERNALICNMILDPEVGAPVLGGRFDFGEKVVEVVQMILGGEEAEEEVVRKYQIRDGIDLSTR